MDIVNENTMIITNVIAILAFIFLLPTAIVMWHEARKNKRVNAFVFAFLVSVIAFIAGACTVVVILDYAVYGNEKMGYAFGIIGISIMILAMIALMVKYTTTVYTWLMLKRNEFSKAKNVRKRKRIFRSYK